VPLAEKLSKPNRLRQCLSPARCRRRQAGSLRSPDQLRRPRSPMKIFAQPPGCWLQSSDAANRAPKQKSQPKAPAPEKYLEAFRWMLLTRTFEEKLASMYRGGRITGASTSAKARKQSASLAESFYRKEISSRLSFVTRPARSAFGEPLVDVARTYLGSRAGPMRGRDGNIHRGKPRDGQLAMISHLGAMVPWSSARSWQSADGVRKIYRANDNWGRGNANRRDP